MLARKVDAHNVCCNSVRHVLNLNLESDSDRNKDAH